MIARIISGGSYRKTTHPRWKYVTTEDLVVWVSHCVPEPVQFVTEAGYVIGKWGNHILTIFSGYCFDGASNWPDHPDGMRGFQIHDFGYQLAQILTRKQWDQVMRAIHEADAYAWRHIVYGGVRAGGWTAYGKRDYVKIETISA